jgi:signal transduction histidine kinase
LILAAVTAVPLLPIQCLSMGAIVFAASLGSGHSLFFAMLALAAMCISATLYAQRRMYYGLYLDTLKTSGRLRAFESKAMLAESSDTMVRLTAALAHELSQPLGALSSGIDTLLVVSARQAQTPLEGQAKLLGLQADLRRSLQSSLERLKKTVNRIQRLTNLDEATTQQANLNDLVNEAVGLMKPQIPQGTQFDLALTPVPPVTCRPQRVIAVVCNLLSNSIHALNGDGRIAVSTALRDSLLELKVEDNGRGIPADQLAHIFDPRFQIEEGRVSTGNWSLFTSRQYIKEHGGDIRIQSMEGKGTIVCLTLPCTS